MPARSARVTFAELNLPLGTFFVYTETSEVAEGSDTLALTESYSGPRAARVTFAELVIPDRGEIVYTETGTVAEGADTITIVDAYGGPRSARVTWAALEFAAREAIVYDEFSGFPFGYPPWDVPDPVLTTITSADRISLVALGICVASDRPGAVAVARDYVGSLWAA